MSFSGRVSRESHLRGLLVDFEGKPPRLGARIRISGGKIIGRVDTVLGPVGSALIHIHPLYNGIDARASVGSPVEIAPRDNSHQGRPRGRHSSGNFRERGGPRKGSSRDKGGRTFRDNKGTGHGGRGPNQPRRGPKGENRSSNNSRRRRDSGKSGRGKRR